LAMSRMMPPPVLTLIDVSSPPGPLLRKLTSTTTTAERPQRTRPQGTASRAFVSV
jgi:hypothetical protein